MALFQQSVVNKYIEMQAQETLDAKWDIYKNHFLSPTIQNEIRNFTEIQYQGGFLTDLFVNILGYTRPPMPNFNLTTELRNVNDAKRVDGAILLAGEVHGVIELKDTKTTDLKKVEPQAFGYKHNHPNCIYVITSNFEKLRFYVDNAVEHLEFNLFALTKEEFALLYLCLSYQSISQNLPKKIKEESIGKETEITESLYKDYSHFKQELYENLLQLNAIEPELLLRKTQKLLDRFLFLCFAEDKLLLPSNSVRSVLDRWINPHWIDDKRTLYNMFKKYFDYLNTGFHRNNHEIFNYNGGLFKADETLDALLIDDEVLYQNMAKLADYNFASEVDVNILGRIFENSLNSTSRKKDGVFYTPRYITKYIIENTVGKLCQEQKEKLEFREEEFAITPPQTKNKKEKELFEKEKKHLLEKISAYREWLLQLTILDPACGSGAFLNEALQFLIEEHKYIDKLQAKLLRDSLSLENITNEILENNIFGVDLNEESVEIAKLSLWLRTAQRGRKLSSLTNNIKCGNSLIDDVQIAGNKAFNWQENFPKVFAKGGFDVVIGNPPYVGRSSFMDDKTKFFIKHNYTSSEGKFELYQLFIEKCFNLCKCKSALISLITPQTWLSILQANKLRKLVFENNELEKLLFLGKNIFQGASVDSLIFIIHKGVENQCIKVFDKQYFINNENVFNEIKYSDLDKQTYIIPINTNENATDLLTKIKENTVELAEIGTWSDGVKVVGEEAKKFAFQNTKFDDTFYPMVFGKDISRYSLEWNGFFCCRNKSAIQKKKATDIRLRKDSMFLRDKILIRKTANEIVATADFNNYYNEQSLFCFGLENKDFNLKYILSILNSKLAFYLLNENAFSKKETFPQIRLHWLKEFPIKKVPITQQNLLVAESDKMLSLNKDLQEISQTFQRRIAGKLNPNPVPQNLQKVCLEPSFGDFLNKLEKKNIFLSRTERTAWESDFQEVKTLANEIAQTDNKIDQMVCKLYGLTLEEIAIEEKE
jgi:type I restriction-modification system DNA methylase subunit